MVEGDKLTYTSFGICAFEEEISGSPSVDKGLSSHEYGKHKV